MLPQKPTIFYSIMEVARLSCISRFCAYGTCTTCGYVEVFVVVMDSIARHIALTRKEATYDFAGEGNDCTGMSGESP